MRHVVVVGVSLLAVGMTACSKKDEAAKGGEAAPAAASAGPVTMPHRKAGLWTQTISTEGMKQSMQICFDNDTDSRMTVWGQAMGADNKCSKNTVLPVPGGWKVDSVCEMGQAGTIAATSTITGDFNSAYAVKVTSTTTGAAMAQANGTREVAIDAKWEGACPAGMKGGDIKVAGMPAGMTLNIEQMSAMTGGK